MTEDKEQKLIEILSNNHLNNLKFKEVLEWAKFEVVKSVKKQLSDMSEKEKESLLENLEKSIEKAQARAKQELEAQQKVMEAKVNAAKPVESVDDKKSD
jgi:hypothetical protein